MSTISHLGPLLLYSNTPSPAEAITIAVMRHRRRPTNGPLMLCV